ncbi:MAG: hypothetical protein JSS81_07795 [Acidobacteria bacterium]|nr:hypothetical protein [Acidobacteriota bacterium]
MKKTIKNTAVTENKNEMPAPEKKTRRRYESGHPKTLEAFARMIAAGGQFDQARLNPPPDLTLDALEHAYAQALALQTAVWSARADFRTAALERQMLVDRFDSLATQAVGQLFGRGASLETAEDARGYVRKLRGTGSKPAASQNPSSPNFDPSARNISTTQRSNAARIATFLELLDFLEAQSAYAMVTQPELLIPNLRSLAAEAQSKHGVSITSAAALTRHRYERNKRFYLEPNNLCDLAARYKELVKGVFGARSPEFKTIRSFRFRKPKL